MLAGAERVTGEPSLAYFGGRLYAAWAEQVPGTERLSTDRASQIYVRAYTGSAWVEAGAGSASGRGVSQAVFGAVTPKLAAGSGGMTLTYVRQDLAGAARSLTLDALRWTGTAFVPQFASNNVGTGIAKLPVSLVSYDLAVDAAGRPFVTWTSAETGSFGVFVKGSPTAASRVFTADAATSVQSILDSQTLVAGDIIVVAENATVAGFTVTAADSGVTIVASRAGTVSGAITIDGASAVTLQGLTVAGAITLRNATGVELTGNTTSTVSIEGGSANRLFNNTISAAPTKAALGFAGSATTGLAVVGNTFIGTGTGILVDRAIAGRIEGNVVRTTSVGIAITAASTVAIAGNDIGYGGTGIAYGASARLNGNVIHHNAIGISSSVADPAAALGYGADAYANTLSQNTIGLSLQGALVTGQRIIGNVTGVTGSGVLGGLDAAHANIIERNGTGVSAFTGTISFNRIGFNDTAGIQATSGQRIVNNVIYRNGLAGILVTGTTTDVRIGNNTVYASDAAADAIRVAAFASNVEIVGNILWSEAGTAIYVENTAQSGFFSDYNTLYAGDAGSLVFWTRAFVDILDWQADVARFDLHSVGRTVIDPAFARPAFADLARNDFRIFAPSAGQQAASPSALGGDPYGRFLGLLDGLNLLANAGFENGLTGWTTNVGASAMTANPAPYNGSRAFSGGAQAIGSAAQQINLLDRGFSAAQIDGTSLEVVFGGRVWLQAAANDDLDTVSIKLVFRDGSGNAIGDPVTISQTIAETRWNLLWDRLRLPSGTRSIDWSFTTARLGSNNPVYLDDAMLAVVPRTLATSQGAYASEMAVHAATSTLRLRSPDLYVDWEVDRLKAIRWDSTGTLTGTPVRIELWQDGPDGPAFRATIAAQTQDDGEFIWMPSQSGVAAGEKGLRIKVLHVGAPDVFDLTTETFSVPELGNTYYVDDGSNSGDVFTRMRLAPTAIRASLPLRPSPIGQPAADL